MTNLGIELTRRVKVHSIYGMNGIPRYFKGQYEDQIKTYKCSKSSNVLVEEIKAEHLLPTLALEFSITGPDNVRSNIRLVKVAQL